MGTEAQHASPEPAVFRTTFGIPMLLTLPVVCLNLFIATQFPPLDGVSFAILALSAATVVLMVYAMLSTKYRVERGILHVRMGPFKRSIAIDSITSITGYGITRGRVYGLGSDIVGITFEGGAIDITPKDSDGFLAAIGFSSPSREMP